MRNLLTQSRARRLRRQLTDAERRLWKYLRRDISGYHFRRQVPVGPFIADFACLNPAIVIELDGGQHALQKTYDSKRDEFLRSRGFRVLRFWDNDVLTQTDSVLEVIVREMDETLRS
jgi:very-short-patch-repair endonuclease